MISGSLFRYSLPFFLEWLISASRGFFGVSAIGLLLWFFLLSPLGMHISGFHNQFDNFAILTALFSICFLKGHEKKWSIGQAWITAILLGISLTIKHIFLFFPIWLFFSQHQQ